MAREGLAGKAGGGHPLGVSRPGLLSVELRALVRRAGALLGEVAREGGREGLYRRIEAVRGDMVLARGARGRAKEAALRRGWRRLRAVPDSERVMFARAYTLYLEAVNACENAYRTHRLRAGLSRPGRRPGKARLVYVLTAHPTEARSPANIALMRRLQDLLLESLSSGRPLDSEQAKSVLRLAWRAGTHPAHKPRPEDEARHLYSLFTDEILDEVLALGLEGHRLLFRTWVGGDKDGHPGVGPAQLAASLSLARARLAGYLEGRLLAPLAKDLSYIGPGRWDAPLGRARAELARARTLRPGDGGRMCRLRVLLQQADARLRASLGHSHPALRRALRLMDMFPALVIPLELREDREGFLPGSPIARMMALPRRLAAGGSFSWYVRGCVVSMASEPEDILRASALARKVVGSRELPIIPLFEVPAALEGAERVVAACWKDPQFRRDAGAQGRRLEVMLGYSDTAKRVGSLPSRLAIARAMSGLGRWARRERVRLVFFHGSGGSVGRGGGTIEEQAAAWPRSALETIKMTLQGEMVERTLATPEILRSQVLHAAAVQGGRRAVRRGDPLTAELAAAAGAEFAGLVADAGFLGLLRRATPYERLSTLNIGSRPSRRAGADPFGSLRAIPWVMCWTQTRLPMPSWYGIGTAWRRLSSRPGAAARLRRAAAEDPMLRSYVRLLGFSLAKSEPLVWEAYARRLSAGKGGPALDRLARDMAGARAFVDAAGGGKGLLWDRPWLMESIRYRAPMIHPLNLLQIEVLAKRRWSRRDELLFRETVTGVSAGVLTTG